MKLDKIRIGNYVSYNNRLVEITAIDFTKGIVCVDSNTLLQEYYIKPVILSSNVKIDFFNEIRKDDNFSKKLLIFLYQQNLALHSLQNEYFDYYKYPLLIDIGWFCIIQQSLL